MGHLCDAPRYDLGLRRGVEIRAIEMAAGFSILCKLLWRRRVRVSSIRVTSTGANSHHSMPKPPPVSAVLATSGVLAIVLGLAMQNTLADVFSGLAINIEQPFGAGDWITLADHVQGQIIEINWRAASSNH